MPDKGETNLTLADKNYTLNFGEDPISKYGKVDIKKDHGTKVVSTKDGDFLQYTVTVTAGEDGCPDVSVVDAFTSDSDQVTYMNVTNTAQKLNSRANGQNPYETGGTDTGSIYLGNKTSDTEVPKEGSTINNSLVWKIGDMAARETRTLTYFVKLKNGISSETKSMNNNAVVFFKENKKSYATSTFTPSVNYSMNKSNGTSTEIKKNSDGSYTIKYQLNFSLNKDNSNYSLKDFKFYDFLNYNDQYHFRVDSRALPYVNYDKSSFNLSIKRDGDKDFTEVDSSEYQIDWKGSDLTGFELSGKNDGFMVNPGDSYKVTYSLTVQPEVQLNGLSCVGTIEIPALDLKLPVTSEWSYDLMKQAPCRYYGSIYQKNMVIAAHNSWFHFGRLSHLKEGKKVIFTDAKEHRFIYRVKVVEALSPDCVEEVTNGKYPLTLFTCTLDAKNRVVVRCA